MKEFDNVWLFTNGPEWFGWWARSDTIHCALKNARPAINLGILFFFSLKEIRSARTYSRTAIRPCQQPLKKKREKLFLLVCVLFRITKKHELSNQLWMFFFWYVTSISLKKKKVGMSHFNAQRSRRRLLQKKKGVKEETSTVIHGLKKTKQSRK